MAGYGRGHHTSGAIRVRRRVFDEYFAASAVYAWSPRGERAHCSAPRNWGKNITLLLSMTLSGLGPSLAVEGATTRAVFEAYVEKALAPSLHPGQVVVMDNLLRPTRERG